jgi:hypothetical protein
MPKKFSSSFSRCQSRARLSDEAQLVELGYRYMREAKTSFGWIEVELLVAVCRENRVSEMELLRCSSDSNLAG